MKTTTPRFAEPGPEIDALVSRVLDAALAVHRELGPGYSEAVYERALAIELESREIPYQAQHAVAITYGGVEVGTAYLDLFVANELVVELKAVEHLAAVHLAQVRSYLVATGRTLGLLINFNVRFLRDGVRRVIASQRSN